MPHAEPPAASPTAGLDPVHDILSYESHPLNAIFKPTNVAVLGASEKHGSVGRTLLWNLVTNPFGGTVFPVNPKRSSVLGIKAYPSVKEVPEPVDLAVIVTPAQIVPGLVEECAEAGVKGIVVISAGFKEMGDPGIELEQQILEHARKARIRVIGPNCLGVMMPRSGLNATFGGVMARPGNVAFISQSGALCTAVLDWSVQQNVGFSAFVSIGSMVDVDWGDLISYLGSDPHTNSIVCYMETIGNARSFLSAAREVALSKPIIVIKAGRTSAAAKAAASHTGSLVGSDGVLEAAFRRTGVLRIDRISDLFYMSEILSKQPRPKGPNLTILTNAGGPGVLATDALIMTGGQLAEIGQDTFEELNTFLPPHWSRNNPIDILGDADPERYARALEISARDPKSDGLMVILTPQDMTDPTQTAEALRKYANLGDKPILAAWMGGSVVKAGEAILNNAGIPTFEYPDMAARLFSYMWRYSYNLKGLYETSELQRETEEAVCNREYASTLIEMARRQGRTILTEHESKQLLSSYGVPTVATRIAETAADAVAAAQDLGYPVVLKLHSETITHKTDVGGVKLNLKSADDVRKAFEDIEKSVREKAGGGFDGVNIQPMIKLEGLELIIGSSIDPQFGPVLLFGAGGTLVEVMQDRALGLPPLTSTLARRMMEQTKIYTALKGFRGKAGVDMAVLEGLMVRFSQLVVEQRWIKEIDINPMLASSEGFVALDARVLLHDPETTEDQLPQVAIRPYPFQYISTGHMKNGREVTFRPIRPEDEQLLVRFHEGLSDQTVRGRWQQSIPLSRRTAHERLTRICFVDYDNEIAIAIEHRDKQTNEVSILGVGRLRKYRSTDEGTFALTIADACQHQGLGTKLVNKLIEIARAEKLHHLSAGVQPDNAAMLKMAEKMGFSQSRTDDGEMIKIELSLR